MKSKPRWNLWGLHKTRRVLSGSRIDRFLGPCDGKRGSPMSNRQFDRNMSRFFQNWAKE